LPSSDLEGLRGASFGHADRRRYNIEDEASIEEAKQANKEFKKMAKK